MPTAVEKGPPHERLEVNSLGRQVRSNSTVQIVSEGMIGGKVLEVRAPGPGTPVGSPAGEDELLRSERSVTPE